MRPIILLAPCFALAAATLSAAPALAQTYKLDKIEINGVKSVSVDDLRAALKEKPGDKVTVNDITADQDLLVKALEKENVTGGVKTSMRNKPGNHIDIIFAVNDTGVQKPVVTTITHMVDPKLGQVLFSGNTLVSTDKLVEAAGMTEGTIITKAMLQDAAGRIQKEYDKEMGRRGKQVSLAIQTASAPSAKSGEVDLTWKLTEGEVKRKKGSSDDSGYGTE
jgi:outer membrane protein assembly factor BamA